MKKEAVLHIPMSQYCHGIDESRVVFRIRAAKDDLLSCTLYYGDTACRQNPVLFTPIAMEKVASSPLFDWFEVEFASPYPRICYYFALSDGEESWLYYSDLFSKETVPDRNEYYKLPFNRREDIADCPRWLKNAVVYNIFPDSFADGKEHIPLKGTELPFGENLCHGRLGGTIRGIEENLDYIADLGCSCIYLNPIFAAGEYHKYDLLDYYHVDPCFGSNEDFRSLVDSCHKRSIRVLIDGVFNHCGWRFFAFEDTVQRGKDSPYWDWFYQLTEPVIRPEDWETIPGYACFGYERLMPKLNTGNPEVVRYFSEVGAYWVREFHIDGWRLDVADEVDRGFWHAFRKAVKAENPEAALIGEVWQTAAYWLDGTMFDSVMNYDFMKHCRGFFAEGSMDASEFDGRVSHMRLRYRKNLSYGQLNLLDSHDVPRFLSRCGGDMRRYRLALLFQLCFMGAPSIFYGDEQGLMGVEELDYRQPMSFHGDRTLLNFVKTLITLRNGHPCLRTGEYRTLLAQGQGYGFERYDRQECIRVYLNAGEEAISLPPMDEESLLLQYNLHGNRLSSYGYAITVR